MGEKQRPVVYVHIQKQLSTKGKIASSKLGGHGQGRANAVMNNSFLESFMSSRLRLARIVGRIVKHDDVEDILQETFISTYAASRSRKIDNQQAFMVRVARNLALDHVKRAGVKTTSSLEDIDEDSLVSEHNTEVNHQINEQFLEFCRIVAELPSSCRRVLILKKVYGLTLEEIALVQDISTSTVEKHVAKGLAFVIEHMRANGHTSVPVAFVNDKGRQK